MHCNRLFVTSIAIISPPPPLLGIGQSSLAESRARFRHGFRMRLLPRVVHGVVSIPAQLHRPHLSYHAGHAHAQADREPDVAQGLTNVVVVVVVIVCGINRVFVEHDLTSEAMRPTT